MAEEHQFEGGYPHKAVMPEDREIDLKSQAEALRRPKKKSDELLVASQIARRLADLDPVEAQRVTAYLAEKFRV